MILEDGRIGIWVGLNSTGEVAQYFTEPDEFENRIDSVVSIGYVEAIPTCYDEILTITRGQDNDQ